MNDYITCKSDDALHKYFEGVEIPVEDIAGKYRVPGWRCMTCGWTVGTIGYPPGHLCPDDGERQQARRDDAS